MAQSGREFYGYLFKSDKEPTKVLDALLRGIANYITESIAPLEEKTLSPAKLARFYKAVGGNYDSLFVDVPPPSISWIYASIGCQHTLQPTLDDFQPPSIPALTTRGFVRWQSIEILLGPEEHVPFIQTAVRNFAIRNPDTGETFPVDLPTEAFPLVANKEIERWHNSCAEKLRQRATPNEEDEEAARRDLPPRPKVRSGFAHVRPGTGGRGDYSEPKYRSRPIPYQHVSATGAGPSGLPTRPKLSRSPAHQARQFFSPDLPPESPSSTTARGRRRRSFPENIASPTSTSPLTPAPAVPPRHARRHSHPRQARRGSRSSDASSSEGGDTDDPPSPVNANVNYVPGVSSATAAAGIAAAAARRRSHPPASTRDSPPIIRFAPAPPPGPTAGTSTTAPAPPPPDARPRRRISRERAAEALSEETVLEEREKRASFVSGTIPVDRTGKLSAPFLLGNRDRKVNGNGNSNGTRRRNDSKGPTVKWKDLSGVQLGDSSTFTPTPTPPSGFSSAPASSSPPFRRRRGASGSKSSEEDRLPNPTLSRRSSGRRGSEHELQQQQDSGSSESRRRRPRVRDGDEDWDRVDRVDRDREKGRGSEADVAQRPLLRERRYSSHEDGMWRRREQDRERDLAGRERVFRDGDGVRDGLRRGGSPVRGVDGRKYPSVR